MDAANIKHQTSTIPPAVSAGGMGVTLSEEFVDAVQARIPARIRVALWSLREVTRCPDPLAAAAVLVHVLDVAIRTAVVELDPGRRLPEAMIPQIRGCVVDAVLGPRTRCTRAGGPDRDSETLPVLVDKATPAVGPPAGSGTYCPDP